MKEPPRNEVLGLRLHALPPPTSENEERKRSVPPRGALHLTTAPRPVLAASDAWELTRIAERLGEVIESNDALSNELARCHSQLDALYEITEDLSRLDDPNLIEDTLLRRLGRTIGAAALLVDRGPEARVILLGDGCNTIERLSAETVRLALSDEINRSRKRGRARLIVGQKGGGNVVGRIHALIGGLRTGRTEYSTVIALRGDEQPPFVDADRLVMESLLVYGGHILAGATMRRRLERSALETVCALANVIEARDPYTSGHSERVGWLGRLTGELLGLSEGDVLELGWAGRLHDVGKIGIAERILNKPGDLTEVEFEQIKQHPRLSYEMLRPVSSLGPNLLDAVLHHHEDYDGSGYPDGLAGESISLGARILRIVDVFDALTSTRPYRAGKTVEQALAIIADGAGRETDPHVTRLFVQEIRRLLSRPTGEFRTLFGHLNNNRPFAAPAESA